MTIRVILKAFRGFIYVTVGALFLFLPVTGVASWQRIMAGFMALVYGSYRMYVAFHANPGSGDADHHDRSDSE